ncbi:ABC transporter ATP-binding protein [Mongoliitalea lutea]|uniref:ABC transporter ATP-binding protein n=1 Tax=Mongoliitalea lutea TaxID=849756 RepID=A0A8J3G597_9BACT|nr:ABC transporter ATP-binding protein [Mongoliitalea lutea]GHB37244.1 ABC transporter ATP-binding protein [Mongoliitalea lutea]
MAGEVLIKVEGVSKKFCKDLKTSLWYGVKDLVFGIKGHNSDGELRPKEFWAVRDINFELRRGECLGLIGHNGAGKSTLLKILNGLINPDAGTVTMRGRVGALIELGAGFNPILTGRENIYNNGAVLGFTRKEIDSKVDAIIDFAEIRDFIDMPVQNYSSGMKVRLGFAVAAQMEPDILIIDEVLAVGDVGFRFKCLNAIGELMKNSAVIFVSHSMPMIYRVCNEVMLMKAGKNMIFTNNIGLGVKEYYKLFKKGQENIVGSREAKVESFELISGDQIVHAGGMIEIHHGDSLICNLKIKLEAHIPKASVQLVIWNEEMLPVMDVMSQEKEGFIIDNSENSSQLISVRLTDLYLNNGRHTVSVMINAPDLSVSYCRHDNIAEIYMVLDTASAAHVIYPAKWDVN